VAGNVPVDQGVQNALYTLEVCRREVPVYRGLAAPLNRPLETAQYVHGDDGMGDIGLPLSGRQHSGDNAVEVIVDTIHRFAGQITLVTLGPLTNIAAALERDPGITREIAKCVIMGGTGRGHGNVTPVAEYNFWADPEAAKIVFESGIPITMVGWDISRTYATVNPEETAQLLGFNTPLASYCVDIQGTVQHYAVNQSRLPGFDLPDPIAMAVALRPEVATETKSLFVAIEAGSELCRGQSVVDHYDITGQKPNTEVVLQASRDLFWGMLCDAVRME
jgi:purine nucleosidase